MIFFVDHEAQRLFPVQHQSAAGALGSMLAAYEMAFNEDLLVQGGQTIHSPCESPLHFGQRFYGWPKQLQHANPFRLLSPTREGSILKVTRQPDAAGHDNPIMRPFAARALGRGDEKDVQFHESVSSQQGWLLAP